MVLLLDAANTIIYKPQFYIKFIDVLKKYNLIVDIKDLHLIHKIISECYQFPDRTSKEFYTEFNKEVLYGLGIISSEKILDSLYNACSYLDWEKFEDTKYLREIPLKKAVLSNFHGGLVEVLDNLFENEFTSLTISEHERVRKPEAKFFLKAIENLGVEPSEILYIGDSVKLDLEPGLNAGMNAWLIDRDNYYPYCNRRIKSLKEIINLI